MKMPDDPALTAGVLLIGHTGARTLEIGFLHDDVPIDEASWWASADYQGTRVMVENHLGPVEAVEGLAKKLLVGARCQWCMGLVALDEHGAFAYAGGVMLDGSKMPDTAEGIGALGQCLWERHDARWEPGCIHGRSTAPGAPRDRASVRRVKREYEKSRGRHE